MKKTEMIKEKNFMIKYEVDENRVEFMVFPVEDWTKIITKEKGFSFFDKENPHKTIDIFDEDKCLKKMDGSFCWRGIWEGRLYFTDDEYWGEEISELSDLYNNYIILWCKNMIDPENQNKD